MPGQRWCFRCGRRLGEPRRLLVGLLVLVAVSALVGGTVLLLAGEVPPPAYPPPGLTATPRPTHTPRPTSTPRPTPVVTGDVCHDGVCLEVTAVSWFLAFVEGEGGMEGLDTCQPRSDYTAEFAVQIKASNRSGVDLLIQYSDHDFHVEDNAGQPFQLMSFSCSAGLFSQRSYRPGTHEVMLGTGQETLLGPTYVWQEGPQGMLGSGRSTTQVLGYKGHIGANTQYLVLSVTDFSRIPYAAWKFEVPR